MSSHLGDRFQKPVVCPILRELIRFPFGPYGLERTNLKDEMNSNLCCGRSWRSTRRHCDVHVL